jgi:transcriptional regulator GlxA family with amidase domain
MTVDGQPVAASNGLQVVPDAPLTDTISMTALFVCSGINVDRIASKPILIWLRRLARRKLSMGGICTGSYLLARADH